mgnify:CR=1 FL=1
MGNGTPISRIMATNILAIDICESLQSVYDLFQRYTIDDIPVTEKGILKGMISRSTLNCIRPSIYKSTSVGKIMSRQFIYLSSENPITTAMEIFKMNIFKLIPIVDKKQTLVGILTPQHLSFSSNIKNRNRMSSEVNFNW